MCMKYKNGKKLSAHSVPPVALCLTELLKVAPSRGFSISNFLNFQHLLAQRELRNWLSPPLHLFVLGDQHLLLAFLYCHPDHLFESLEIFGLLQTETLFHPFLSSLLIINLFVPNSLISRLLCSSVALHPYLVLFNPETNNVTNTISSFKIVFCLMQTLK